MQRSQYLRLCLEVKLRKSSANVVSGSIRGTAEKNESSKDLSVPGRRTLRQNGPKKGSDRRSNFEVSVFDFASDEIPIISPLTRLLQSSLRSVCSFIPQLKVRSRLDKKNQKKLAHDAASGERRSLLTRSLSGATSHSGTICFTSVNQDFPA